MIQASQDNEERRIDENNYRINERIIAFVPDEELKCVKNNYCDSKYLKAFECSLSSQQIKLMTHQQKVEESLPPPEINFQLWKSSDQAQVAESHYVNRAVYDWEH